jgi:hypothetical protein
MVCGVWDYLVRLPAERLALFEQKNPQRRNRR